MILQTVPVTGNGFIRTRNALLRDHTRGPLTIAHGYLILALIPYFWKQSCQLPDIRMSLNYGLNRVRFPAPVSVGTRIRARFHIVEVSPVDGGTQARFVVTIERENQEKPACVAEVLTRFCT
jgi:acyl dehydratase